MHLCACKLLSLHAASPSPFKFPMFHIFVNYFAGEYNKLTLNQQHGCFSASCHHAGFWRAHWEGRPQMRPVLALPCPCMHQRGMLACCQGKASLDLLSKVLWRHLHWMLHPFLSPLCRCSHPLLHEVTDKTSSEPSNIVSTSELISDTVTQIMEWSAPTPLPPPPPPIPCLSRLCCMALPASPPAQPFCVVNALHNCQCAITVLT